MLSNDQGFVPTRQNSAVADFYDGEVRAVYYPEVERLVKDAKLWHGFVCRRRSVEDGGCYEGGSCRCLKSRAGCLPVLADALDAPNHPGAREAWCEGDGTRLLFPGHGTDNVGLRESLKDETSVRNDTEETTALSE